LSCARLPRHSWLGRHSSRAWARGPPQLPGGRWWPPPPPLASPRGPPRPRVGSLRCLTRPRAGRRRSHLGADQSSRGALRRPCVPRHPQRRRPSVPPPKYS
jgi:hypothetical protein